MDGYPVVEDTADHASFVDLLPLPIPLTHLAGHKTRGVPGGIGRGRCLDIP